MDRNEAITKLATYAVQTGLVEENEYIWAVNTILDVLKLDDYTPVPWDHQQVELAPVLEALLDDGSRPILVAVDGEDWVLGYAFCVRQSRRGDGALQDLETLYLDDLCVDEACRGQHVGQALYEAVVELARSLGCYNVTLNVWSCNREAMAFYERCGLRPQKVGLEQIL